MQLTTDFAKEFNMINVKTNLLLKQPFVRIKDFEEESYVYGNLLHDAKIRLFDILLTEYPQRYYDIQFEVRCPIAEELYECCESYKGGGQYWLEGVSICREELEKRLSKINCILILKCSAKRGYERTIIN